MAEPGEWTFKARSALNRFCEALQGSGKHVPLPPFTGTKSNEALLDWINSVKSTLSTISEGYRAYVEMRDIPDDSFTQHLPIQFLEEDGDPGPEAMEMIHQARARVMYNIRLRTHDMVYGSCLQHEPRALVDQRQFAEQGEDTPHYHTLNIKHAEQRHIKHLKISPKAKKILVKTLKHLIRQQTHSRLCTLKHLNVNQNPNKKHSFGGRL